MTLESSLCSVFPLIYIHLPPSILDAEFISSPEILSYPLLKSILSFCWTAVDCSDLFSDRFVVGSDIVLGECPRS